MEKHGAKIKKLLLAVILLVMLLPLIEQHVKFYESERLYGAIVPKEPAYFSSTGWWNGEFQEQYGDWYNENFGFRRDLVRLHNQFAYSVFGEAKANSVVIGKEGYLYESNYIRAYTGKDFLGFAEIDASTNKLKEVQDSLEKKGITLIVCLAAGKASFYPEYIPDEFGPGVDTSNYKVYAKMIAEKQINCIDYNQWFREMKGKTPFPLYPKTGIHWSRYGCMLAIDSLIRYVEHARNVDMPNVVEDSTYYADTLLSPDQDIGLAMNLVWPIKPMPMGTPVFHYQDTTGKAKVKLMTFSDSFFWNFFITGLAPSSFENVDFYYYNKEVYHSDGRPMEIADPIVTAEEAEKHDVIVIMGTEATMYGFGWGFIGEAFNHFVLHKMVSSRDALISQYVRMIRMDVNWMNDITVKAKESGTPLDSMIYLDAVYMADQDLSKQK